MDEDVRLRYPIGKENEQQEFTEDFSDTLKAKLIADIKMLPSSLDFAIQNLDEEQLKTPYRPGGMDGASINTSYCR